MVATCLSKQRQQVSISAKRHAWVKYGGYRLLIQCLSTATSKQPPNLRTSPSWTESAPTRLSNPRHQEKGIIVAMSLTMYLEEVDIEVKEHQTSVWQPQRVVEQVQVPRRHLQNQPQRRLEQNELPRSGSVTAKRMTRESTLQPSCTIAT